MARLFRGSEIVDIAVRIEQNGYRFYTEFQNSLDAKAAKDVFGYLAGEEKKHEETFSQMLSGVGSYEPPESMQTDYDLYMQAIAESHIFSNDATVELIARSAKNVDEALKIGISFEKDSILFFQEMLDYVPESQHKTIKRLIGEEKKHLAKLAELKQSLAG